MPVVADRELARVGVESEAQLTALEDHAVVVAEHRHEHATRHRYVERMPVDVEVAGVCRRRAVLEHVEPPSVVGPHDAHVVRHHVKDEPEAMRAERGDEVLEARAAAELRVDRAVVDDVVAVGAAGTRAQDRRAVEVAHAEPREVRRETRRIGEGEGAVELDAVRRARDAGGRGAPVTPDVLVLGDDAVAARPLDDRLVSHRVPPARRPRSTAAARLARARPARRSHRGFRRVAARWSRTRPGRGSRRGRGTSRRRGSTRR